MSGRIYPSTDSESLSEVSLRKSVIRFGSSSDDYMFYRRPGSSALNSPPLIAKKNLSERVPVGLGHNCIRENSDSETHTQLLEESVV